MFLSAAFLALSGDAANYPVYTTNIPHTTYPYEKLHVEYVVHTKLKEVGWKLCTLCMCVSVCAYLWIRHRYIIVDCSWEDPLKAFCPV